MALAEAFEARLVEIDDRDRAGRRRSGGGPEKGVVDLPLDGIGQRRGPATDRSTEQREERTGDEKRESGSRFGPATLSNRDLYPAVSWFADLVAGGYEGIVLPVGRDVEDGGVDSIPG